MEKIPKAFNSGDCRACEAAAASSVRWVLPSSDTQQSGRVDKYTSLGKLHRKRAYTEGNRQKSILNILDTKSPTSVIFEYLVSYVIHPASQSILGLQPIY